jgi:exonuclease III
MSDINYHSKYLKYKTKYLELVNSSYMGGAALEAVKKESEVVVDLQPLSAPFDKIPSHDLPDIIHITIPKHMVKDIQNDNPRVVAFLKSNEIFKGVVEFFQDFFIRQFTQNKISDHSMISYRINEINIVSLNLLDDTYSILTMFFKYLNSRINPIYTHALTVALNNVRIERMTKIVELVESAEPDIICFQEVNSPMLPELEYKLGRSGFNNYIINKTLDTFIHNKVVYNREQFRTIFYKGKKLPPGEIMFTDKAQSYLIYNDILIFSLHITWKLNLVNPGPGRPQTQYNASRDQLKSFINSIISLGREHNILKIVLVGDTNNSAENLYNAIRSMELDDIVFQVHESQDSTFYVELNGSDKIDNLIDITLLPPRK